MRTLVLAVSLIFLVSCADSVVRTQEEVQGTVVEVRVLPSTGSQRDFACRFSAEFPNGEKRTFFSRAAAVDDQAHYCSLLKIGDKETFSLYTSSKGGLRYYSWRRIRESHSAS